MTAFMSLVVFLLAYNVKKVFVQFSVRKLFFTDRVKYVKYQPRIAAISESAVPPVH